MAEPQDFSAEESGPSRYLGAVTGCARLGVLAAECLGIEPRAMGAESAAAQGRVAAEAVALGMTGDAALQILPRRLAVPQEKELLGVVITRVQLASGAQTCLHVAVGAELAGVMTIAAVGLPRIGRCWMPGKKTSRMIARGGVGRIRAMAVETLRPYVTTFTCLGPGVGHWAVSLREIRAVRRRPLTPDYRTSSPPWTSHRKHSDGAGLASMAGEAALLGVTGGAFAGRAARLPAVFEHKVRFGMARRCSQLSLVRRGARIRSQGLNHRDLWSIHMTFGAEVAGVTGGAGR